MIGKVLAQYQISEKLGEGGMGVVWKARDTNLDRFVALKTLSAERLADPERKRRFMQEAKAASGLNHPNIVHIYDIADADGIQFIAMEYVAGKTLDQLIGRKGLRLNEVLKYAVQIADALARAHAAGIIHWDLKPSNLMIDDHGLVKVLPKRSREGEKLPGNFKSRGDPVFHARTAFLHYVVDVWVEAWRKKVARDNSATAPAAA
jgi:serine/threonine protein kinase